MWGFSENIKSTLNPKPDCSEPAWEALIAKFEEVKKGGRLVLNDIGYTESWSERLLCKSMWEASADASLAGGPMYAAQIRSQINETANQTPSLVNPGRSSRFTPNPNP